MMKNLIFLFIIYAFLGGCTKNDTTPTGYVSGHLYESCGGMPLKNQGLYIYQQYTGTKATGTLATGGSDSTGYFKIPYGTSNPINPIELRLEGGNYAVCTWPFYSTDIDDLNVYNISTCNIAVGLNVINSYTTNDTLQITNFNPPYVVLKIPGPFVKWLIIYSKQFSNTFT